MSESIDRRVVEMRFDNKDFEQNVNTTMTVLEKLKEKLSFKGAGEKFETTSGLSSAIDGVKNRFSALEVVGMTALVNLTNSAVNLGKRLAKSLTTDQVKAGFSEYELKMGSMQTIMASTGESIETVNKYLNDLNTYSDKTIYSFSDMTNSIGKFTNAGVDLNTAVAAIQGISNEAAVSGANAQEASRAMYNFAQALSAGYVKLIDWKSIENANMATKEFKQQLIDTAVAEGNLEKSADGTYKVLTKGANGGFKDSITATKNFNDSLSAAWMTTDVLTKTLSRYADESTDIGKKAFAAAQDVKTFTQLVDTVKEAIGSGWAQTFEIIFGNLEEAKKLWTSVNNVISDFVDKTSTARNDMLQGWKDFTFGGIKSNAVVEKFGLSIGGLSKNTEEAAMAQRVFDKATEDGRVSLNNWKKIEFAGMATKEFKQQLMDTAVEMGTLEQNADGTYKVLTEAGKKSNKQFRDNISATKGFNNSLNEAWLTADVFAKTLAKSSDELVVIGDTARDVLIKSLGNIFKGFAGLISPIAEAFKTAFSPITSEQLVNFTLKFASLSDAFRSTMSVLGHNLQLPFTDIFKAGKDVVDLLKDSFVMLFQAITGNGGESALFSFVVVFANFIATLARGVSAVVSFIRAIGVLDVVRDILVSINDALFMVLDNVAAGGSALREMFSGVAAPLSKVGDQIKTVFSGFDISLVSVISKISAAVGKLFELIGKGLSKLNLAKLGGILAGGGILAAGLKISKLVGTITEKLEGIFGGKEGGEGKGGLIGNIKKTLSGLSDTLNDFQTAIKVGSLLTIAIAIGILAASCYTLSTIPAGRLSAAVAGIGGLFLELSAASHMMKSAQTKGIAAMSVAIVILAHAVKTLSEIENMSQGMLGVAGLLGEIAAFCLVFDKLKIRPKSLRKTGEGLILMSVAINILAKSVQELGAMNSDNLIQGLLAIAAMLGGFTLTALAFSKIKTKGLVKAAGSMIIMAVAMRMLAKPLSEIGAMDLPTLIKGLSGMGVALLELAGFTFVMSKIAETSGSIMKASAALLIMAVGIKIMAGAIQQMGANEHLGKGLTALFGSLLILSMAMAAMQNSLAGAAAMIIVAGALAVMAPAIALLSSLNFGGVVTGLVALAGTLVIFGVGAALLGPLVPVMLGLAAAMALLGVGVLSLGAGLTMLVGAFALASTTIIAGAKAIGQAIPVIAEGIGDGIIAIIKTIGNAAIEIKNSFVKVIKALLGAVAESVPAIVKCGITLLKGLLEGIRANISDITKLAIDIITRFVDALADGIPKLVDSGFNLIISLLNSMADAISENSERLTNAIVNVLLSALGAVVGLIPGFGKKGKEMIDEYRKGFEDKATVNKLGKTTKQISSDIEKNVKVKDQTETGKNVVKGLNKGMEDLLPTLRATSKKVSDIVDDTIRKRNEISSPSRRLRRTGVYLMQGLIGGIDSLTSDYQDRADNISTMMIASANRSVDSVNNIMSKGFSDGFNFEDSIDRAITVSLSMDKFTDRNAELNKRLFKLTTTLDGMTESMNSRSLNNYISIDGTSDPEAFADDLIRSFRLNARTV